MSLAQQTTVHRLTGLMLTSSGTGSIRFGGERPYVTASAANVQRSVRSAPTRPTVVLDVDWTFEERLVGPWPTDPGPPLWQWLAMGLLASVLLAHGACLATGRF